MEVLLYMHTAAPLNTATRQSSNQVIMLRPSSFGFNPETAEDNAFMNAEADVPKAEIGQTAREEFEGLVSALKQEGVKVTIVEDEKIPPKRDAVFLNNWFSTHEDGSWVTYPMFAETRRLERNTPVLQTLKRSFAVKREMALDPSEEDELFLEGTGSLVLDRINRVAYLVRSLRSDEVLARRWAELFEYELLAFDARDADGLPIYHTNVVMAIGTGTAIFCAEVCDDQDAERVRARFRKTGHRLIEISYRQVLQFAGNALEVIDGQGRPRWVMSESAYSALNSDQRSALQQNGPIIYAPIPTIETIGGGSARCMIAEIFLPQLKA